MAEAALRREVAGSTGTGRQSAVRQVLDKVKAEGRLALTAPEGKSRGIIKSARKQAAREGHFSHYSRSERGR